VLDNNSTQTSSGLVELSAGTKYVPFRFEGGSQADLLRISFSGGNYLTPIVLESIVIGGFAGATSLNTEFDMTLPNINFKTFGNSGSFTKVLCLTGLTRSAGDVLIFEISPQGIAPTEFTFCFTQLGTFDCEMCALTSDYYKIVESSVSAGTSDCGGTRIIFNVSGCSSSVDVNEDLYKYIFSGSSSALVDNAYGSVGKTIDLTTTGPQGCPIQYYNYLGTPTDCIVLPYDQVMTYTNTVSSGVRTITLKTAFQAGNNWLTYLQNIYNTFQSTISTANSSGIFNNSDPNNIAYWSTIILNLQNLDFFSNGAPKFYQICYVEGASAQQNAKAYNPTTRFGDNPFKFAANNVTCTLTTVGLNTTLTITGQNFAADPESTIKLEYAGNCYRRNCNSVEDSFTFQKGEINDSLLSTSFNTPPSGNLIDLSIIEPNYNFIAFNANPWSYETIVLTPTNPLTSASTFNRISMYQYENKTFPLTGTSGNYGVRVAQTATTCPNIINYTFDENSGTTTLNNYVKYNYLYNVSYIDNLDGTKYQITATPISSNGQPNTTTPPILVGTGTSNPSTFDVIDPTYFTP
jgi:hypothetical protein